jgi:hypothetical protein
MLCLCGHSLSHTLASVYFARILGNSACYHSEWAAFMGFAAQNVLGIRGLCCSGCPAFNVAVQTVQPCCLSECLAFAGIAAQNACRALRALPFRMLRLHGHCHSENLAFTHVAIQNDWPSLKHCCSENILHLHGCHCSECSALMDVVSTHGLCCSDCLALVGVPIQNNMLGLLRALLLRTLSLHRPCRLTCLTFADIAVQTGQLSLEGRCH